jgi:hypothetical protein
MGGSPSEPGIDMMLMIAGGVLLVLIIALIGGVWLCCRRRQRKPVDERRKPVVEDDEYFMDNQDMNQPEEMSVEPSESSSDSLHGRIPASPGGLLPPESDHSLGGAKFSFQDGGHDSAQDVYRQPGLGPAPEEADPGWSPAPSSPGEADWKSNPWGGGGIPDAMLSSSDSSDASEEELVDRSVAPSTASVTNRTRGSTRSRSTASGSEGGDVSSSFFDEGSFTQNTSRGTDTFEPSSEDEEDHSNDFEDEEDGSLYDDEGDPTEPSEFFEDDDMDEADTIADTIAETVADNTHLSLTSAERNAQLKYRGEVERLVRQVVPEEAENVQSMLEQFFGREQVRGVAGLRSRKTVVPSRSKANDRIPVSLCSHVVLLLRSTGID